MTPNPSSQPFLMSLIAAFPIKDRGIVVHGIVQRGSAKPGDKIEILGLDQPTTQTTIAGIPHIHFASIEDQIASIQSGKTDLLLKDVSMEDCAQGRMIAEAGSIQAHNRFKCNLHVLDMDEGGRT